MMPNQFPKRGLIPTPRNVLAAAVPYSARVGAAPNSIVIPKQISFWGNYDNGDCVTAEEAFAKACNNPEIFVSDDEVITWATKHGVLNGASITQVMTWMQNDGFPEDPLTYDDGPYYSVDWTNAGTLESAISEGPVKLGVAGDQLNNTWWAAGGGATGGVSGWFATGFKDDGNEDHSVSLCGYGSISWLAQQLGVQVPAGIDGAQPGYAMFTWDSVGIIDVPSMIAITQEAWLRQPTTVTRDLWNVQQLNGGGLTRAPAAAGDPAVVEYNNQMHTCYRDGNGLIQDAWYDGQGHWNVQQLNGGAATHGPAAAGDPAVVEYNNQMHTCYRDGNGLIQDAWYDG